MNQMDKRRDHLANERTFLSWIRTCIGIMAFGFVVARFAIFAGAIRLEGGGYIPHPSSSYLGISLIAVGTILSTLAFIRFRAETRDIEAGTQSPSSSKIVLIATALVSLSGIVLILYLSRAFR